MTLNLTDDEKQLILKLRKDEEELILARRKADEQKKEKKRKLELDSKSPTDLTHGELIERLRKKDKEIEKLNAQLFIDRANARKIHHNKSGDWRWDNADKPYIHQM